MEPPEAAIAAENIEARQVHRRAARLILLMAAIVFLAVCILRAAVSWHNDANMDHVVGVWAAMSQDLLHGVFYRRVYGPLGYGGTRYMPLFFTVLAALWKAFGSWRVAGHLIVGGSLFALLAGVYVFLRRFAVERWLAFGAACAVLAGVGGKYALLDIRADGLAAALNLWGVIAMAPRRVVDESTADRSRHASWMRTAAPVLFTLAFATKVTAVFGVAAVVLWLVLERRRAQALWLAAATAVGYAVVLLETNLASHGRFLQVLRATAAGGGDHAFMLSAPVRLSDELFASAPDTVLVVLALAAVIGVARRWRSLPALLFVATLLVTLVIFGSPGTVGNHLIDLEAASVIIIGVYVSEHRAWREFGAIALAVVMVVCSLHYYDEYKDTDTEPMRQHYADIERAVLATGKPVLGDNPILAIDSGEPPYVLDPFMFRVLALRDPKLAQPLWNRLDRREFGAVVLEYDPRGDEGKYVYQSVHFGDPFLEHLTANYEFVKQVGDVFVWKPKGATLPGLTDDQNE